jgi:hypothetical protein
LMIMNLKNPNKHTLQAGIEKYRFFGSAQ